MDTVIIKNKLLYKLYKDLPYTLNNATMHIFDCLIKQSQQSKTIISLYLNLDDNWIQINANINLYNVNHHDHLWQRNLDLNMFDWRYPVFFLGQSMVLEIKQNDIHVSGAISLLDNQTTLDMNPVTEPSVLDQYTEATQLSITDYNFVINENDILKLAEQLSYVYQNKFETNALSIQMIIIKNNQSYQIINKQLVLVKHISELEPILPATIRTLNSVKNELIYNDKNYQIECEIFASDKPQISFSNKNRVITNLCDNQFFSAFFDCYNPCGINIKILNLKLNLFRTDFSWQFLPQNILLDHVKKTIQPFLTKNTSTAILQTTLMTEEYNVDQMTDLKQLLTASFDGSPTKRFDDFEIKKDKLKFTYHADDNKEIVINLIKTKLKDFRHDWLQLESVKEESIEQNYEYNVTFNIEHPFFKDFMINKELSCKIEQFMICYAIAETICRLDDSNVTQLKYEINKLLRGS